MVIDPRINVVEPDPDRSRHGPNAGWTTGQRQRRWPVVQPALGLSHANRDALRVWSGDSASPRTRDWDEVAHPKYRRGRTYTHKINEILWEDGNAGLTLPEFWINIANVGSAFCWQCFYGFDRQVKVEHISQGAYFWLPVLCWFVLSSMLKYNIRYSLASNY